jgi:hypothetical protein
MTMFDSQAQVMTDGASRRWNTGASLAAGLLAGAVALVGATMPMSGASGPSHTASAASASALAGAVRDSDG